MTIGSRIGKPVDRNRQLAGDLWFYYAGRYGEYLGEMKQAGAEDYLAARVEAAPQQSQPYFELAEYFRGAGDVIAAGAGYHNALELNAGRADAHDRRRLIAVQISTPKRKKRCPSIPQCQCGYGWPGSWATCDD